MVRDTFLSFPVKWPGANAGVRLHFTNEAREDVSRIMSRRDACTRRKAGASPTAVLTSVSRPVRARARALGGRSQTPKSMRAVPQPSAWFGGLGQGCRFL